jgi:PadR family transcriptional regulator, regulatory protein PadR
LILTAIYVDLLTMIRKRKPSAQTAALLAALLGQPRMWRHGYDLSIETELKSGTLYPVLMRLSERGMLDSKWEPGDEPGRPPRHMYRLTANGCAFAKEHFAALAPKGSQRNLVGARA